MSLIFLFSTIFVCDSLRVVNSLNQPIRFQDIKRVLNADLRNSCLRTEAQAKDKVYWEANDGSLEFNRYSTLHHVERVTVYHVNTVCIGHNSEFMITVDLWCEDTDHYRLHLTGSPVMRTAQKMLNTVKQKVFACFCLLCIQWFSLDYFHSMWLAKM